MISRRVTGVRKCGLTDENTIYHFTILLTGITLLYKKMKIYKVLSKITNNNKKGTRLCLSESQESHSTVRFQQKIHDNVMQSKNRGMDRSTLFNRSDEDNEES